MPRGLPVLSKFSPHGIKQLLLPMAHTRTAELSEKKLLIETSRKKMQENLEAASSKKGRNAKNKLHDAAAHGTSPAKTRQKKTKQDIKRSAAELVETDQAEADDVKSSVFLDVVNADCDYMCKLDPRQQLKAKSFWSHAIYGALCGAVELTIDGKKKSMQGYSAMVKCTKASIYRYAKLAPRQSDPDFESGELADPHACGVDSAT